MKVIVIGAGLGGLTLLGDAIHPAPGRGRLGLLDTIGAYEDTMRRNGFAKAST